jgi:hypothetical protein
MIVQAIGFADVLEVDDFESVRLTDGSVTGVPFFGEHADLTVRGKTGYAIRLKDRTAVLLADSRCLEPQVYEMTRRQVGPVAALFIGMECEGSPMTAANGPYLPDGIHTDAMAKSRRTNASDAAGALKVIDALEPGCAYVYAMGLEPWLSYMFGVPDPTKTYSLSQTEILIAECAARGVLAKLLTGTAILDLGAAAE